MKVPKPTYPFIYEFQIGSESSEERGRADKALHQLFSEHAALQHLSRSQIQRMLENGDILVNQKSIQARDRLLPGSMIEIKFQEPTSLEEIKPESIPVQVLYEDADLLIVNKQPGLTVHPSETQAAGTLVNALLFQVKDLSGIGGKLRPGIVHRIDKNTSGALVISKNDQSHLGLSKLFSTHQIIRKYWALVYGAPKIQGSLTLETLLARHPQDRIRMAVIPTENQSRGGKIVGRKAISHFRILQEFALPRKAPFASLVEATLETGRTHQVRVHLAHLGHSVLGDPLYGKPTAAHTKWKSLPNKIQEAIRGLPGQALHARVLGFQHPISGKTLHFEANLFPEFQHLLDELHNFIT